MYKVSVIMPIYNVSRYLRQALDSVINQTLEEVEVVCVNDGSTDDSLDIVKEYAAKDPRIVIITGPNGGYGKAMNKGLCAATGEYIGILEPDDYIAPEMLSDLYAIAKEHDLDMVKADFYRFKTDPDGNEVLTYEHIDRKGMYYGKLMHPCEDPETMRIMMNTWTGIYRRAFIEEHNIRHNETPGASFQDNGFFFQTFIHARRAMVVDKPYYHNRRDNPGSSVQDPNKVYTINIEYDFIRDLLMRDRVIWERFKYMYWWKKYHNAFFALERIGDQYKKEYLQWMQREFRRAMEKGELSQEVFTALEWDKIHSLIHNADGFYGTVKSAKLVQKLIPYIPESVKRIIMKIISRRNRS